MQDVPTCLLIDTLPPPACQCQLFVDIICASVYLLICRTSSGEVHAQYLLLLLFYIQYYPEWRRNSALALPQAFPLLLSIFVSAQTTNNTESQMSPALPEMLLQARKLFIGAILHLCVFRIASKHCLINILIYV